MLLVDTSVWIDHLRSADQELVECLGRGEVCVHPMVIGELALGSLRDRRTVIDSLRHLPSSSVATHGELLHVIEQRRLHGSGLGLVDAHLIASALLDGSSLWSRDRRLRQAAERMAVPVRH